MSSTILSIGPENPAYYTDLLQDTASLVDQRLPSHEQPCPTIPGIQGIQGIDDTLTRRLQTLLDDIASISLCERRNMSATAACLKNSNDTLETQLYIVFNHQDDDAHRRCCQHLESIFTMLRRVPYKPPEMDGSPQLITNDLETNLLEICRAIHNYSFGIFAHRVNKHQHEMSNIQKCIAEGQPTFASPLSTFLQQVGMIIRTVSQAQATKQLSIIQIRMLLGIYSFWTKNLLLPRDPLVDNTVTLLDTADTFLAGE